MISLSTVENTTLNSLNIMFCYKFLPLLSLFSYSVMSDSLQSHGLRHAKLPCPSLTSLTLLLEFAQTHVHWVDDAIQLYPPLLPPSPPALSLSQHWVFSNELALHIGCLLHVFGCSDFQGIYTCNWYIFLVNKSFVFI